MFKQNLIGADGLILTAAFRYALGRQSYMVDHVATFIEKNADRLTPEICQRIIQEIDEQKRVASLGMDMDEHRWMRVRARMEAQIAAPSQIERMPHGCQS